MINGLGWHDVTEFPRLGTTEVWDFINRSNETHPLHMHLVRFQILDRQNFTVGSDGVTIIPTGPRTPPPADEAGWKDTARCPPTQITRVIARFEDYSGMYPYHCHMLEHEDNEMMRQMQVMPACGSLRLQLRRRLGHRRGYRVLLRLPRRHLPRRALHQQRRL